MAELAIHTLEDCGCGKKKNGGCKTCGDKSVNGDPANSGNYNVINIGNDVIDSGNNTKISAKMNPFERHHERLAPVNTHTREIIVKEREIPKIIERNIPSDRFDSLLVIAENQLHGHSLPVRAFKSDYNISLYKAFY